VQGDNVYTQEELVAPTTESSGTELILSDVFTQLDGDSLVYIYTASHKADTDSNVLFRINVTEAANSSNVLSSDIIERDYDVNTGNQFMYGFADGLIEGTEYNISVTRTITGDDILFYSDSLTYFSATNLGVFETIDVTDPVLNVTTPGNTSHYFNGVLVGICTDDFAISSVTVNDTRFVYDTSSMLTNWSSILTKAVFIVSLSL